MEEPIRRYSKSEKARIAASIAAAVVAAAVFAVYFAKNVGNYGAAELMLPLVSLAAFTAVLIAAMPRFVDTFCGSGEGCSFLLKGGPGDLYERKRVLKTFAAICLFALLLHILTFLLGVLLWSQSPVNSSASLRELIRSAWMKRNTDAGHYLNIAENWYVTEGNDKLLLVFFPMFPALIGRLNVLIHDSFISAMIINAVATSLTAGMTYLTLREGLGENRARAAAFIYLLLPGAIFMNSPMSEPLFMLFTVCGFWFLQKKRFIAAGIFAALAGYTRSLGVILAVAIAVCGTGYIVQLIREKKKWGRLLLKLIAALAISSIGTLEYLYINYSLYGNCLKFLEYQSENWFQKATPFFDTPRYMVHYLKIYAKSGMDGVWSLWIPGLAAIFGSLLLMIGRARKLPSHYTAYYLSYFAVAIGCSWLLSSVRYLSACFPLTAAIAMSCNRKWKTALIFAILAATYVIYMYMYMRRHDIY